MWAVIGQETDNAALLMRIRVNAVHVLFDTATRLPPSLWSVLIAGRSPGGIADVIHGHHLA